MEVTSPTRVLPKSRRTARRVTVGLEDRDPDPVRQLVQRAAVEGGAGEVEGEPRDPRDRGDGESDRRLPGGIEGADVPREDPVPRGEEEEEEGIGVEGDDPPRVDRE